jgi:hypothetical protein
MITCFHHTAPGGTMKRLLLVMFAGARIAANEFGERGMVAAMYGRGLAVDIVVAQPAFELFLNGRVADALQ